MENCWNSFLENFNQKILEGNFQHLPKEWLEIINLIPEEEKYKETQNNNKNQEIMQEKSNSSFKNQMNQILNPPKQEIKNKIENANNQNLNTHSNSPQTNSFQTSAQQSSIQESTTQNDDFWLILVDFADPLDLKGTPYSHEKSLNHIIHKLLAKLEVPKKIIRGFALLENCQEGIENQALQERSLAFQKWLLHHKPSMIWCFGFRSLILAQKSLQMPLRDPPENGLALNVHIMGKPCDILKFPSPLELNHFPLWRKKTWEAIQKALSNH